MTLTPTPPPPLGRSLLELVAAAGQPLTRSEIRRRLGLTESHLSHLLRDLEATGLIVRVRPGKGREVLVDLGPEGKKVVEAALLPQWVERLADLIAEAGEGRSLDRKELAETLMESGAPSRAAANRLAEALAGLGRRKAAPVRTSWEIREPALAESGDFAGPVLRPWIEAAAAEKGQSVRDYCRQALRERLAAEGLLPGARPQTAAEAAKALDLLRQQAGPIGIPVRELILEGRRR